MVAETEKWPVITAQQPLFAALVMLQINNNVLIPKF